MVPPLCINKFIYTRSKSDRNCFSNQSILDQYNQFLAVKESLKTFQQLIYTIFVKISSHYEKYIHNF